MQRFEKLFPVPEWAGHSDGEYGYVPTDNPFTNSKRSAAIELLNQGLRGYQSRQPEIDELVEALEDMMSLASEAMVLANRDGAEFDVDEELAIAYALVTKHKGKS